MTQPAIEDATRTRLGLPILSGNPVAEPELRAMLPAGVGVLVIRLPLTRGSRARLPNAPPGFDRRFITPFAMEDAT